MKIFLKKLATLFQKCIKKHSNEIPSGCLLARFLTQSGHFSPTTHRVKQSAFLPAKSLELSIFNIDKLIPHKIWELADKYVLSAERKVYGYAKIFSDIIYNNKLKIDYNNNPERHANIIGWPTEKDEQKLLAIELANASELVLK
jgi:hypothetical protein